MMRRRTASALAVILCAASIGWSQKIAGTALEEASAVVREAVATGQVAGAIHLVVHHGQVIHLEIAGVRDIEEQRPLQRDTILRIYSMSKPIVSVAAMMLQEQGKFELDDPVADFIPVFEDAQVQVQQERASSVESPRRPITVRDLLRHTAGYSYGRDADLQLLPDYRREGMHYHPPERMFPPRMTIAEAAHALARIPASHHPGERFTYGFATDLLGRLIEIWSGQPLESFLQEAVFAPLEMHDTGFSLPPEKRHRLATCHTWVDGKLAVLDKASSSPFNDGFEFVSGGGGLLSTVGDYANFCQMLVDGGTFRGRRLLQASTLDSMWADQLNDVPGDFQFGLGFAIGEVTLGKGETERQAAEYSWGGYASTQFRLVPAERLFQIVMRQRIPMVTDLADQLFSVVHRGLVSKAAADRTEADSRGVARWPGWLGPQRDGWVPDFTPPDPWPEQLIQKWRVQVGTGYGSPLVATGHVFQHARQGDEEVLWCLDLETGQVKWRTSYAAPFKMGQGGERHGKGPKSSPLWAAGRVFTMSITGELSAWDAASGELLWRRDDGSRFKLSHPYWGASTSPIVDGNRVIVHFGTDEAGVLVASDVATGEAIWSAEGDGPSYSSPLVVETDGVRQVVEWNHRALVGVESASGRPLWEYPFPHAGTDQNMPTPAYHQGCVLLGGENRGIRSLKPQLIGGAWTVQENWRQEEVALDMSSAVINDGLLYGFSHYGKGRLFCLDPQTGDLLWQGPGRTGDNVMFLAIPDHVVALVNSGELKVIAASGERLKNVASYQVADTETWAPPVLVQDAILVKDLRSLTLWSLRAAE